jgi:hypothetical protein
MSSARGRADSLNADVLGNAGVTHLATSYFPSRGHRAAIYRWRFPGKRSRG